MVQVYNPQWQRAMAIDTKLSQRMMLHNFGPSHTGGGCFAWERNTDDGGNIWITDDSGMSLGTWAQRNKPVWLIGRYTADDDFINVEGCTLSQAMHLANTMRAPADGERSIFSFADYREG